MKQKQMRITYDTQIKQLARYAILLYVPMFDVFLLKEVGTFLEHLKSF